MFSAAVSVTSPDGCGGRDQTDVHAAGGVGEVDVARRALCVQDAEGRIVGAREIDVEARRPPRCRSRP